MYLRRENAELLLRRASTETEQAILSHKDFLDSLQSDSDWAFAIKIHAFLEALITSLISTHSGAFRLGNIASRLPMNSSDGISKLELVKANSLLSLEQMRFIKKLGEVRNQLAHEVSLVDSFSFAEYISILDGNQLKNWQRDLTFFLIEDDGKNHLNLAVSDPRLAITEALLDLICHIETSKVFRDIDSESQNVMRADTKELVDSMAEKLGVEVASSSHSFELGGQS
jgi:hypothetical protein